MLSKCSNSPKLFSSYTALGTFATPLMRSDGPMVSTADLVVYPKPSTGSVRFKFLCTPDLLMVFDELGREVQIVTVLTDEPLSCN